MLRENPAPPPPLLFSFLSEGWPRVLGLWRSSLLVLYYSYLLCPQDFHPGGPIPTLKALQGRGQTGIFPVDILWATPGKGNQQPLLPVFPWILGANKTIFYSSMTSWGPGQNWKCHTTEYLLLLRTLLCQTQFSGLETSFMPLASSKRLGLALGNCCQLPPNSSETCCHQPWGNAPPFFCVTPKVSYPAFPISFLFKEI